MAGRALAARIRTLAHSCSRLAILPAQRTVRVGWATSFGPLGGAPAAAAAAAGRPPFSLHRARLGGRAVSARHPAPSPQMATPSLSRCAARTALLAAILAAVAVAQFASASPSAFSRSLLQAEEQAAASAEAAGTAAPTAKLSADAARTARAAVVSVEATRSVALETDRRGNVQTSGFVVAVGDDGKVRVRERREGGWWPPPVPPTRRRPLPLLVSLGLRRHRSLELGRPRVARRVHAAVRGRRLGAGKSKGRGREGAARGGRRHQPTFSPLQLYRLNWPTTTPPTMSPSCASTRPTWAPAPPRPPPSPSAPPPT